MEPLNHSQDSATQAGPGQDNISLLDKKVDYLARYFSNGLKPPPRLTVSEWADKYRKLPRVSSGEPGRWRTDRTPYLKEIMDELSPSSHAEEVVFMKGSQIGGTESGINWILSIINCNPAATLSVQPTIDMAKRYSRQRVSPSIRECDATKDVVQENKSRDGGNTILQKDFPGGTLIMTGANSAAGLRSMPICNLFADEVDAWPDDVEGEGDPLELAKKRITNFARRKCFECSTPTIAGMSRIEKLFAKSDQRYFYVPCPFCGHYQVITWDSIRFDNHDPETARMVCEKCAAEIREHNKTEMLVKGEWRKQNPTSKIPGFHLSALYSPLGWYSWKKAVAEHLEALGDPMKRKVWTNTVLAELWNDSMVTIDHHWLSKRAEKYPCDVPAGGLVLCAGVDTQDDRLELIVYAYGAEFENWVIEHKVFIGDPGQAIVWGLLDMHLQKRYRHESGAEMLVASTCVDAMGHHTDSVYSFCKARFFRRIFAIQGHGGAGRPLFMKANNKNRAGVYLFHLGVDQGKETLYNRLKIKEPGPGYCHFPEGLPESFYKQLTSEKRIMRHNAGLPKLEWVLPKGKRNEILDISVYAMAALTILNPNLALLQKQNLIYTGVPQVQKPARRIR